MLSKMFRNMSSTGTTLSSTCLSQDKVSIHVTDMDLVSSFTRLALEYKLKVIYKAEFHEVYAEHCEHPEFSPLLQRMKVIDAKGESQMDEDQWEAASEYLIPWD